MQPMAMPAICPLESPLLLLVLPEELFVFAVEDVASSPAAFFAVPVASPEVVVVVPVEVMVLAGVAVGYASPGVGVVETGVE